MPLTLSGQVCLFRGEKAKGAFSKFMSANAEVFRKYFGCDLHPGSLNVVLDNWQGVHDMLDRGDVVPAIRIPRDHLSRMPDYFGDAQAWRAELHGDKLRKPHRCWVFRRIGDKIPLDLIELLAVESLKDTYGLEHGDNVEVTLEGQTD